MLTTIAYHLARAVHTPSSRELPVRPLRALVALPRVFDLVSLSLQILDLGRLRKIDQGYAIDDPHHRQVQDYNAGVTKSKVITTTRRAERLYRLLSIAKPSIINERLLIIGPRNRAELLLAWVNGFSWRKIDAIDLYSVNSKIKVMNMESMTWPDESFGALAMANTLSYADDTGKVIREVARVLKPGGLFAFTATYDPDGDRWKEDEVSAKAIVEFLRSAQFELQLHQGVDKINSERRRQTSHDFVARKVPAGETRLDQFQL